MSLRRLWKLSQNEIVKNSLGQTYAKPKINLARRYRLLKKMLNV